MLVVWSYWFLGCIVTQGQRTDTITNICNLAKCNDHYPQQYLRQLITPYLKCFQLLHCKTSQRFSFYLLFLLHHLSVLNMFKIRIYVSPYTNSSVWIFLLSEWHQHWPNWSGQVRNLGEILYSPLLLPHRLFKGQIDFLSITALASLRSLLILQNHRSLARPT